jgi:hypothetical protein
MTAAAIPLLLHLGATGRGEVLEQARHRTGGTVCGNQLVTPEGGFPLALAAGDQGPRQVKGVMTYPVGTTNQSRGHRRVGVRSRAGV